jgi:hypothetical protein
MHLFFSFVHSKRPRITSSILLRAFAATFSPNLLVYPSLRIVKRVPLTR